WRVYASWFGDREVFVIKSVGTPHSCPRTVYNKAATTKWIAKKYLRRFKRNPEMDMKGFQQELKEGLNIKVSLRVCINAKNEAKRMIQGALDEAYARLRKYILALKKADPEGKFVVEVDPFIGQQYVRFKRMYVGFPCLRKGFRQGCRKMFALDGCFLKGEVKGMLLSVVGKDGNNQMYPIAWAVVEGENTSSWNWFLSLLVMELQLEDGTGWSVIFDQQKVTLSLFTNYLSPDM
ncbi:hypothetical protein LINGRAPRIM_LOCUS851, partial [Linum grandiflorum]